MKKSIDVETLFKKEKVFKILLKIAPHVMLAQLIQALYNIVDSLFIGAYQESGLTALSIVYPIQLLMIALAVGSGVGLNTVISSKLGQGKKKEADEYAGVGSVLAIVLWAIFALITWFIMPYYADLFTDSNQVINDVVIYGRVVCVFSFGIFLESIYEKIIQAKGNMRLPMIAQMVGALVNIALDAVLIFGFLNVPALGILGAAIATVIGQVVSALIVFKKGFYKSPNIKKYPEYIKNIFILGLPNILMQAAYTIYILGLNLILSRFGDDAVTALGLYYKWQTFFFIPLGAMQTCIVPVLSFNYASKNLTRCKSILVTSILLGMALMSLGTLCFEIMPGLLLNAFSNKQEVIDIGTIAFRIIGISFIPQVTSLIFPVFFQAIGKGIKSTLLTITRTILLFLPLGYLFSLIGLNYFWLAFPVTETVTTLVGFILYLDYKRKPYKLEYKFNKEIGHGKPIIQESKPGVIITISRSHGSLGKEIGHLVAEKLDIPFYFKDVVALAAQESGLSKEYIDYVHGTYSKKIYSLYMSSRVSSYAIKAQESVIKKIANAGSCVIVGRCADYILKDNENVIKIFIDANKQIRIKRIMEVYGDNKKQAEKSMNASDKARANYYKEVSNKKWDDIDNYDLFIDSSNGVDECVDKIINFISQNKKDEQYYVHQQV